MSFPRTTAILGLGLMGGSLARDLARRGERAIGYDADPEILAAALAEGVIGGPLDASLAGVAGADLVVLALPVDAALRSLERIGPLLQSDTLVTDLGSTKRGVVRAAESLGMGERFVGSHPLAGDHRSGWEAARAGLYEGACVYLCPAESALPDTLAAIEHFWIHLGATPEVTTAEEHDRRLAWISHLPQVASSALALTLAAGGHQRVSLGPGGRDVTRLAGSSPAMWSAIALQNADLLVAPLEELIGRLSGLAAALERGDEEAVRAFFRGAREWVG
jgi:prephenate dehydrogenase